jgi:hypothetical protein
MKRRRLREPLYLSEQYIAEGQNRVKRQKQVIEKLTNAGRSTRDAENILTTLETQLLKLLNHREVMRGLML